LAAPHSRHANALSPFAHFTAQFLRKTVLPSFDQL
jgi:hypothetical protein